MSWLQVPAHVNTLRSGQLPWSCLSDGFTPSNRRSLQAGRVVWGLTLVVSYVVPGFLQQGLVRQWLISQQGWSVPVT